MLQKKPKQTWLQMKGPGKTNYPLWHLSFSFLNLILFCFFVSPPTDSMSVSINTVVNPGISRFSTRLNLAWRKDMKSLGAIYEFRKKKNFDNEKLQFVQIFLLNDWHVCSSMKPSHVSGTLLKRIVIWLWHMWMFSCDFAKIRQSDQWFKLIIEY